jgi:hypothetical protein
MSGAKHTPGRVRVTMSHEEFQLLRAAPDLAKALLGLEYRARAGRLLTTIPRPRARAVTDARRPEVAHG